MRIMNTQRAYRMTHKPAHTRLSKFLSFVLRHRPERIGLQLDPAGWVEIDGLLDACRRHGRNLDRVLLEEIVAQDRTGRYSISDDGLKIRANQGHSVAVALGYPPREPPAVLFHGTHPGARAAIVRGGLKKMNRHHVHLSAERSTAAQVGGRRGKPIIFMVNAAAMHKAGHIFRCSDNGVWLVDHVPPIYLRQA